MNERLKELRGELNFNQKEFSSRINISQPALAMMEKGSRVLRDIHISRISSEFNVNEDWLRTGKGEMFVENDSTIITELATEYRLDDIDKKIIEHYVNLDDHARQELKKHIVSLAQKIIGLDETAASIEQIAKEEAQAYRQKILAELKTQKSSASPEQKGKSV